MIIQVLLESVKNNVRVLYMKTDIHFFIVSRSVLLRMRNVSEKIVEKIKTHILCSMNTFSKSL